MLHDVLHELRWRTELIVRFERFHDRRVELADRAQFRIGGHVGHEVHTTGFFDQPVERIRTKSRRQIGELRSLVPVRQIHVLDDHRFRSQVHGYLVGPTIFLGHVGDVSLAATERSGRADDVGFGSAVLTLGNGLLQRWAVIIARFISQHHQHDPPTVVVPVMSPVVNDLDHRRKDVLQAGWIGRSRLDSVHDLVELVGWFLGDKCRLCPEQHDAAQKRLFHAGELAGGVERPQLTVDAFQSFDECLALGHDAARGVDHPDDKNLSLLQIAGDLPRDPVECRVELNQRLTRGSRHDDRLAQFPSLGDVVAGQLLQVRIDFHRGNRCGLGFGIVGDFQTDGSRIDCFANFCFPVIGVRQFVFRGFHWLLEWWWIREDCLDGLQFQIASLVERDSGEREQQPQVEHDAQRCAGDTTHPGRIAGRLAIVFDSQLQQDRFVGPVQRVDIVVLDIIGQHGDLRGLTPETATRGNSSVSNPVAKQENLTQSNTFVG